MSEATAAGAYPRRWRPPPLIADSRLRWALALAALAYLIVGIGTIDVNWARVSEGLGRAARLLSGFLVPDFASRWSDILDGMIESLTMTVTSTVAGIALSVPFALGAARNLAPTWLYLCCRGVIAFARAFQEVIIAIFFVAMFGFGPLAGFLTKLLADDIEEVDPPQMEAVRATGASWWKLVAWGVVPQVTPRLVGLSLYRFDINFRESAVLGIVGAGGIGATLNTALDRYEFDDAAAILILIIVIVMACEYASSFIRGRIQ